MSGTSIPAWVKPGVKCVCVDAHTAPASGLGFGWHPSETPVEGQVYIIKAAWLDALTGVPVADFAELQRSTLTVLAYGRRIGFGLWRFRPVVSDSDELGIETILYREKRLKSKTSVRSVERA